MRNTSLKIVSGKVGLTDSVSFVLPISSDVHTDPAFCAACTIKWELTGGEKLQLWRIFDDKPTEIKRVINIRRFHYLILAICPKCLRTIPIWSSKAVDKVGFLAGYPKWPEFVEIVEAISKGISIYCVKARLSFLFMRYMN